MIKINNLIYFSIGFFAQMFQILIFREILYITSGNEFAIGMVFFIWFLFSALGSFVGKKISYKFYIFSISVYPVIFLTSLVFLKLNRIIFNPGQGQLINLWTTVAYSVLTIGLVAMSGSIITILSFRHFKDKDFSKVYLFDSLGHMTAGIVFTFIFIIFFPAHIILFSLIFIYSIFHSIVSIKSNKKIYFILSLCFILFSFCIPKSYRSLVVKNWKSFNKSFKFIETIDTPYSNLSLLEYEGIYNLYSNGQLELTFPETVSFLPEIYTAFCEIPKKEKTKILLIGGGGCDLANLYSLAKKNVLVTDIEIDKKKFFFLQKYYKSKNKGNINTVFTDARKFISKTIKKFDIISLHSGIPDTLLVSRYFSKEFFNSVKKHLNSDGIFIFTLPSSENYQGKFMTSLNKIVYKALKNSFANIVISPGDTNTFFASNSNYLTQDSSILMDRYNKYSFNNSVFSPFQFQMIFPPWKKGKTKSKLEKNINLYNQNSDLKPEIVSFSLLNHFEMLNPNFRSFFSKLKSGFNFSFVFILPIFVFLALKKYKISSFSSVFFISFSGITIQLFAFFLYQLYFGTIYSEIGILTSAFMIGIITSIFKNNNYSLKSVFSLIIFSSVLLMLTSFSTLYILNRLMLFIITIMAGIIIGLGFKVILKRNPSNYISIYIGDLLGSAVCSIGILTFLLPEVGFIAILSIIIAYSILSLGVNYIRP